jgi:hypothetical protein
MYYSARTSITIMTFISEEVKGIDFSLLSHDQKTFLITISDIFSKSIHLMSCYDNILYGL